MTIGYKGVRPRVEGFPCTVLADHRPGSITSEGLVGDSFSRSSCCAGIVVKVTPPLELVDLTKGSPEAELGAGRGREIGGTGAGARAALGEKLVWDVFRTRAFVGDGPSKPTPIRRVASRYARAGKETAFCIVLIIWLRLSGAAWWSCVGTAEEASRPCCE